MNSKQYLKVENQIKYYIEQHSLIESGDHIVVGVSGGADSMALLHFLHTNKVYYNITLRVAHINHGIRDDANLDYLHVKHKCDEWGIPISLYECNIKEVAAKEKISEEEAGRNIRYTFFRSLLQPKGKIATAHNKDDQTETMLMRFFRGSDIKGLGGIKPKRQDIIRPLLNTSRDDIEAYCKVNNIVYRQDYTNFMPIYTRNKIRLECIPYIKKHFNPNIINTLMEASNLYQEEEVFLKNYTQKALERIVTSTNEVCKLDILALMQEDIYIQKRIIYTCLQHTIGESKNIGTVHIQDVLRLCTLQTGKVVHLPKGVEAYRSYDTIDIRSRQKVEMTMEDQDLQLGKNVTLLGEFDIAIRNIAELKTFEQTSQNRYTKYIDYDKIKDKLCVRTRRPQDIIVLNNGTKKLKKFFVDEKVPALARGNMPLIADGNEIVWVVGSRLNTNYYVTNTTQHVLEIKARITQKEQEGLC